MTDIYIDAGVLGLPGSSDSLTHLLDGGHALVLVDPEGAADTSFDWTARLAQLPEDPARGSWLVTADPGRCADRPAGLSVILIAPAGMADPSRPTVRCDVTARDAHGAVLEILSRDVMA